MPETNFGYAMWVIYGYAIWIFGALAWDWWKKGRPHEKQAAGHQSDPHDVDAATVDDEKLTPAA